MIRVRSALVLALLASSAFGCSETAGDDSSESAAPQAAEGAPAGGHAPDAKSPGPIPAYLAKPAVSTFMSGTELGTPFDSIVDAPMLSGSSAIAKGFTAVDVPGQLQAQASIRRIQTTEDLYSAMEITASLSAHGAKWGVSASTTFARSVEMKSEYLYLFVEASATGRTQRIEGATLESDAKKLSPEDFYKRYGDRYASSIVMGQRVFGLIEIRTKSLEEKESLAVSLGISYGPVSFDASFKSTLASKTTSQDTSVVSGALGTTMPLKTDVDGFLDEVDQKFNAFAAAKSDPGTQTISLEYTSYASLPGYPGLPSGVEAKVAEHAAAASDALLYRSLVADFTAEQYDFSDPVLAGVKSYATSLDGYLAQSLETTPSLPALPMPSAASSIDSFAIVQETVYSAGSTTHAYANGFVPKHLRDYEIPLRYTRDGKRGAVAYSPLTVNQPVAAYANATPSSVHLWKVRRVEPTGPKECWAFRWSAGPSYYVTDVTGPDGKFDPALAQARLSGNFRDLADPAVGFKHFVLVNEASGLVLSRAGDALVQAPLVANASTQWWGTTRQPIATFGLNLALVWSGALNDTMNTWFVQDGAVMDLDHGSSAAGAALLPWGFNGGTNQTFKLEAEGSFIAIRTSTGGLVSVDVTPTNGNPLAHLAAGQKIVQLPPAASGKPGAHQRWLFVPTERLEQGI